MDDNTRYGSVRPAAISMSSEKLWVTLSDGRVIATPLAWYPWLAQAAPEQQANIELLPDGIYWNALDEGLEVEGMLRGIRPYTPKEETLPNSEHFEMR